MNADLTGCSSTPFYRLRWVLRLAQPTHLPVHQAGVVYALLAQANRTEEDATAIPDGLMLDVPEQCRIQVLGGELFAFGGTWIESQSSALQERLRALNRRLRALGRRREHKSSDGLGGNFDVYGIEDLVAQRSIDRGELPRPIPIEHISDEIGRLLALDELTLRFTSPLRLERPRGESRDGHHFFDRDYFHPVLFLQRLVRRLPAIGIVRRDAAADEAAEFPPEAAAVLENRLIWLDLAYGPRDARKSLGGAVGRVTLRVTSELAKAALVWGQYARLGKNLHFGFGSYRIEQLGPDPFACRRARGLVEIAVRSPALDRVAEQAGLPSGELRVAAGAILRKEYQPEPPQTIEITDRDGSPRRLAVPPPRDRALQRLVLDWLGPALDKFFEVSSLAWRKGLGRHRAPERIQRAYRDGFRFALREDFDRFFDSIDHRELTERLEAYLADDELTALLMEWVRSGAPAPGCGLPTGAPLSPLLGNLLLDRFDEKIAAQGAMLVRYADDFLVLCRTREQAEAMHQVAADAAEKLRLALNDAQPNVSDFQEPFDFLGFRFLKQEQWQADGQGVRALDEVGWHDVSAEKAKQRPQIALPGETNSLAPADALVGVLGPGLAELTAVGDGLRYRYHGQAARTVAANQLGTLVLLDSVALSREVLRLWAKHQVTVLLAEAGGHVRGLLTADSEDDPQSLLAQARAVECPERRLAVARQLVAAKLRNYAVLARSAPGRRGDSGLDAELQQAAARACEAESLDQLRGIEGAGAARWYGEFRHRLGNGFRFERRVAPQAEDPVNVLLNIGYTVLYRWMIVSARAAGLSPALGMFHVADGRFAALAADLQEPFRHLIDRVVIEATYELRVKQFQPMAQGPFALGLAPLASRRFQELLHRSLALAAAGQDQSEPCSYHRQFIRQARSLRRHLQDVGQPFVPFSYP